MRIQTNYTFGNIKVYLDGKPGEKLTEKWLKFNLFKRAVPQIEFVCLFAIIKKSIFINYLLSQYQSCWFLEAAVANIYYSVAKVGNKLQSGP